MKHVATWWLITGKGIILTLAGLCSLLPLSNGILGLATYIGIALFMSGALLLVYSFLDYRENHSWGWQLPEAIFDIFIACTMLSNVFLTALTLPVAVGFYGLLTGMYWVIQALIIRLNGHGCWVMSFVTGALNASLAILILYSTVSFTGNIQYPVAGLFISHGSLLIVLSWAVRKLGHYNRI